MFVEALLDQLRRSLATSRLMLRKEGLRKGMWAVLGVLLKRRS